MTDSDRERALRIVEAELHRFIGRVRRQIAQTADRMSPGMQPAVFTTFTAIARRGPITSSELAELLAVDKGLLSRTVAQLEQLGFVERSPDPDDGRVSLLSMSAAGRVRLSEVRRPGEDPVATALADWELDDIRTFAVLLHAMGARAAPRGFDELDADPFAADRDFRGTA